MGVLFKETHPDSTYPECETYMWWCPGCKTHHSFMTKSGIRRQDWKFDGNMEKPTFSPSYLTGSAQYKDGKPIPGTEFTIHRCHSYVEKGMIKYLDDCYHALKGQTVPMEDVKGHD